MARGTQASDAARSNKRRRYLLLAGIVGLWLIWDYYKPTKMRVDDWCLSYDRHAVEAVGDEWLSPMLIPYFQVDYSPQVAELSHLPPVELNVSFWKYVGRHDDYVSGQYAKHLEACDRRTSDFGLYATRDNDAAECTSAFQRTIYDPMVKDEEYGGVVIDCVDNPSVPNCAMREAYASEWEARISFPRAYLPDWKHISDVVDDYFEKNFKDCGGTR